MTYATCQELDVEEADTPGLPHCEAFSMPFSRRVGPRRFEPIPGLHRQLPRELRRP